jgi:CDP-diacylglycerol--glycerol-3-phosphate 3-phosphatidyltransferase
MTRDDYLRAWSSLHGGAGTGGLIGWWLGVVHAGARPLVRLGAGPDVVTVLGLVVALGSVPAALAGGRWSLLAVVAVVGSGLLDGLDGAVALMTGRATRRGFVLDSVCDRIADAGYCAALWVLGAPGPLAVAGGAVAWLHEYVRARATAAGMAEVGVITVSERPTRVIVTAAFLLGAGIHPWAARTWAALGTAAWTTIGLVGLVQLVVVVARRLR